jgi:hypothetical protein
MLSTIITVMAQEATYQYGKLNDDIESSNIYKEQDEASPLLSTIEKGEYFLILSRKNNWANILTLTGINGYIADGHIKIKGKPMESVK